MFGETLFRGYPFNSSGSDNPWIQRAHIEIDHPDKSRDVVVNIRPRMVLFNEKMSGGGILNGPVKQEILFQSIAGPVNVGITRGGPGTHKGLIWQGFDKKKDEFKLVRSDTVSFPYNFCTIKCGALGTGVKGYRKMEKVGQDNEAAVWMLQCTIDTHFFTSGSRGVK